MNYILAAGILLVWLITSMGMSWDLKYSTSANYVYGILIFLLLAAVYWIPFWLIFKM